MFTLHIIDGSRRRGLEDATLSIGIIDPRPSTDRLTIYDFGLGKQTEIDPADVVAVAEGDPARVSFAPTLRVDRATAELRMAANARPSSRRKRAVVPTSFVSGYDRFARDAALHWREHGVGTQPILAAGIFSLASIQTSISRALVLFDMLSSYVVMDMLPSREQMQRIVRSSGAGFDNPKTGRPAWFAEFFDYRLTIADAINAGARDNALRKQLATGTALPLGLGLAKLSFCLALVGNNLGCLDARIISWAFSPTAGEQFVKRTSRKTSKGNVTDMTYQVYRRAELNTLKETPFYEPDNPVALARSQWQLWESLGPAEAREHSHEELFRSIVEPGFALLSER